VLNGRHAADILNGVKILGRIMKNARLHVVLGKGDERLLQELATDSGAQLPDRLELHLGSKKYPQENEAVLVSSVLNVDYPYEFAAIHAGVVLIELQGVLQVFDAVATRETTVRRIVALHGEGFRENLHLQVAVGTPIRQIVDAYATPDGEHRYVYNSLMTGSTIELEEAVIGPDCSAIIAITEGADQMLPFAMPGFRKDSITRSFASAFLPLQVGADTNLHGERRPCISCTYCEQVCPVGLLPYILHRYVERDMVDENLLRYGVQRCVDCNLCSYVCPSKIPLAGLIREGKQKLKAEGLSLAEKTAATFGLRGLPQPEEEAQS
jgi:Na(+)-translocating NADH:ubiquinone oxidoreductase A subunit